MVESESQFIIYLPHYSPLKGNHCQLFAVYPFQLYMQTDTLSEHQFDACQELFKGALVISVHKMDRLSNKDSTLVETDNEI